MGATVTESSVQLAAPARSRRRPAGAMGADARLGCLLELAQILNSSLELDAVLSRILDEATGILGAESGSIMLIEEGTSRLRVAAARGPRARSLRGIRQRVTEGVAGWVVQHDEPLLLRGPASDPRFGGVPGRIDVHDALCVPLRADSRVIGAISLNNCRREGGFTPADLEFLTALANQAAVAIRNARAFAEVQRQRHTVERLLDELARAQEEERKRIALQIHDGPAQTLFAALRNVEAVSAIAGEAREELRGAIGEVEHSVRHAISETRAVMIDLQPPSLVKTGLLPALREYAARFHLRSDVRVQVIHRGQDRPLPPMVEASFYRIVQEALTNVWKHAQARTAWVILEVQAECCWLEIGDDGKGFDPAEVASRESEHLGLRSLRERAELMGGRLALRGQPGEGTIIRLTVPLTEHGAAGGSQTGSEQPSRLPSRAALELADPA